MMDRVGDSLTGPETKSAPAKRKIVQIELETNWFVQISCW